MTEYPSDLMTVVTNTDCLDTSEIVDGRGWSDTYDTVVDAVMTLVNE